MTHCVILPNSLEVVYFLLNIDDIYKWSLVSENSIYCLWYCITYIRFIRHANSNMTLINVFVYLVILNYKLCPTWMDKCQTTTKFFIFFHFLTLISPMLLATIVAFFNLKQIYKYRNRTFGISTYTSQHIHLKYQYIYVCICLCVYVFMNVGVCLSVCACVNACMCAFLHIRFFRKIKQNPQSS